jgi:putative transposase
MRPVGVDGGVESICEVLQVAPSTYYAATSRPPSQRSLDDEVLKGDIIRIHNEHHHGIYGIEKVWWQCQREGVCVGRDRVARLMKELGLSGVVRGGHKTRTTTSDSEQKRPVDLVKRNFKAPAPNPSVSRTLRTYGRGKDDTQGGIGPCPVCR